MKDVVAPPQELADEHTLIAQKYAGYFVGHPYRAAQQKTGPGAIVVDTARAWQEPAVVADACEFCARLTDEEALRRVAGYQHAIDIEVIRPYASRYSEWLLHYALENEELSLGDSVVTRGVLNSAANRRAFLEQAQLELQHAALPMVSLPLRLKRKLCIEWNHLYVAWMKGFGISYDPQSREFYRTVEAAQPAAIAQNDAFAEWWSLGMRQYQASTGGRG